MRPRFFVIAPFILVGIVAFTALGGFLVQWLWNGLLPPLFGWPAVTFWQALGLLVLCRLLFGGLGLHGGRRRRLGGRMRQRCGPFSPDERERFRQRVHERMSGDPAS